MENTINLKSTNGTTVSNFSVEEFQLLTLTQEIKEILDNLFVLYQQNKSKTQIFNELGIEEISETTQTVTLIPNFEEDGLTGKIELTISNNDNNEVFPFKLLITKHFRDIKIGYFINNYFTFYYDYQLFDNFIHLNLSNTDEYKVKFKKDDNECTYFDFLDYIRTKDYIGVQQGVQDIGVQQGVQDIGVQQGVQDIGVQIEVYDKDNNLVATFNSVYQISKQLKLDKSNIRKCLNGQRKTLKGFKFKLI